MYYLYINMYLYTHKPVHATYTHI